MFGQHGYLLLEHLDQDVDQYDRSFIDGLLVIGPEMAPNAIHQKPLRAYRRPT
jgi:hypothetical protein